MSSLLLFPLDVLEAVRLRVYRQSLLPLHSTIRKILTLISSLRRAIRAALRHTRRRPRSLPPLPQLYIERRIGA